MNTKDKDGTYMTPLKRAVYWGDVELVLDYIRMDTGVAAESHKLVIEANANRIKRPIGVKEYELISAGVGVTALNRYQKQRALQYASWVGASSVVRTLTEAGADVNEQDKNRITPLMEAANRGHSQAVHELIRAGASVTAMNRQQKQRAFCYASWEGDSNVVRTLIEAGTDINGQDELMEAAYRGHDQVVYELIRAGASVTALNRCQKQRAIHCASREGDYSVVKALIEAGADVNGQDEDGATPLMYASEECPDQVVCELIRAGAIVTAKDNCQLTALHYAMWRGRSSVIRTLVEAGAEINSQDEDGTTPIMEAANRGHNQAVHELISAGASVTAMNRQQKQRALRYASREGDSSVVRTLIEAGTDVNGQDEDGIALLMVAAAEGHDQVVHELIRAGANVIAKNNRRAFSWFAGSTALHFAAKQNRIKCGILLVEAGADMAARSEESKSPLDLASDDFRQTVQQAQSFAAKRIIAVIGNAEHGKTTLIAALQAESHSLMKRFTNRFAKVQDISQRTTGIEAVQFSSKKYGETLFYDFAGQSDYHGPHQSFLEAMLSKPEVPVTLLVLVKATDEADIITQQITHWLQPLAFMSAPSTPPQVVLVGSFLDQVKSREEATEKLLLCTQSVQEELPFNIQGPCLLDCRKCKSEGINQICTFFTETQPLLLNSST